MDCKEAIKHLENHVREYEESYKEFKLPVFLKIIEVNNLAIKALETQDKINKTIESLTRKYDDYDLILVKEVKDILKDLIIN